MQKTVILGGARTAFGRMSGSLASKTAMELGATAIRCAIERSQVAQDAIEHVIMGQVLQGGCGQIPARQAAFMAGLDKRVTAETINRVCGSGMRALELADLQIRTEMHSVIVAGGMESMSQAPYILRQARGGYRFGDGKLEDLVMTDGLTWVMDGSAMGLHGDTVAAELEINREDQDAWALRSHQRAAAAIDAGRFDEEIVPVEVVTKRDRVLVSTDEAVRRDTSAEALAKLKPAFSENGTVTAGNAPGVTDGAVAMVLTSAEWAQQQALTPLAEVISHGEAAWEAPYLAMTPVLASEIALKRAGLTIDQMDLVEINEAFSNVAVNATRKLGVDPEKVNVNGGAVALGHPIGASGARNVLTLALELKRRGGGLGLAAICSGGGQGDAMIIRVAP